MEKFALKSLSPWRNSGEESRWATWRKIVPGCENTQAPEVGKSQPSKISGRQVGEFLAKERQTRQPRQGATRTSGTLATIGDSTGGATIGFCNTRIPNFTTVSRGLRTRCAPAGHPDFRPPCGPDFSCPTSTGPELLTPREPGLCELLKRKQPTAARFLGSTLSGRGSSRTLSKAGRPTTTR